MELYDYLVLAGVIVAFLLVAKAIWSRVHNGNVNYTYSCDWKYMDVGASFNKEEGYYKTNCNEVFVFKGGSLLENDKFMYCPYCSRKIKSKFHEEEKQHG